MPQIEPRFVAWTDHAVAKAEFLTIPHTDVEEAVFANHRHRTRNTGAADWLIVAGTLAVVYDHPDEDDELAARIVTLWRRA